jgi:hypothetical protein
MVLVVSRKFLKLSTQSVEVSTQSRNGWRNHLLMVQND